MANKTNKNPENGTPVKEVIKSADDFWNIDADDYEEWEEVEYEAGANYE